MFLRRLGLYGLKAYGDLRVRHLGKSEPLWERLLTERFPRPRVVPAAGATADRRVALMLPRLDAALSRADFDCPLLGPGTLVSDYVSIVKPALEAVHALDIPHPAARAELQRAKAVTAGVASLETSAAAAIAAHRAMEQVLIEEGRIDSRLYHLSSRFERNARDKWVWEFVLHSARAEPLEVVVDGDARPAFRCGQPFGPGGIEWVEWPEGTLGGEHAGRRHRVYVQGHVLQQLYGPKGRLDVIENGEWLVHDCLWQSLRYPEIRPSDRGDGRVLVTYRLNGLKVGYLPAVPIDDKVVVLSFLFLTMDGTPEGVALRRKLRLVRGDKEWLGLDDIRTFLASDMAADPGLVRLFEECGCGDLFRLLQEPTPRDEAFRHAARVRSYLGLGGVT